MSLRIAVIGAGGMGREHLANITALDGVEVVAVADVDAERAAAGAAVADAEPSTDPGATAARSDLDGVVIASPDETHAELALAAIAVGTPILCEKPLAVTVPDAERVVRAEQATGRSLVQVGLMRVYDEAHQQIAAALQDLGTLHHLRLVHRNTNAQWTRALPTIFSQSLIHDIHTARWLSASEFSSVVAQVVDDGERIHHVSILGRLESGATVSIEFAEATYGYDVEVEATAEGGMVIAPQPSQPIVRRGGAAHRHIGDDWFGRFAGAYRREAEAWVDALRTGVVRGPSAADGLAAQRVVAAAITSAETGGRVRVDDGLSSAG